MLNNKVNIAELLLEDEKPEQLSSNEVDYRLVAFFAAQGVPMDDIAQRMEKPVEWVDVVLGSSRGSDLMLKYQASLFPNVQDRVKRLASIALDTQVKMLLTSQSEKTLLTLTNNLLDRSMGKAIQVTETRSINVNVDDVDALDRALIAQQERLKKLESMERALLPAGTS